MLKLARLIMLFYSVKFIGTCFTTTRKNDGLSALVLPLPYIYRAEVKCNLKSIGIRGSYPTAHNRHKYFFFFFNELFE